MSRMYRIRVSESVTKLVHVGDAVASDLEILPVLAPERMKELLAGALSARGFACDGDTATREGEDGVLVTVDLACGRVSASVSTVKNVQAHGEHQASVTRAQAQRGAEPRARARLKANLEQAVEHQEKKLQKDATRRLEGTLRDLRGEMDQVVSRVTIEALKVRAGQLGEIEELREDAEKGELTIKVRV